MARRQLLTDEQWARLLAPPSDLLVPPRTIAGGPRPVEIGSADNVGPRGIAVSGARARVIAPGRAGRRLTAPPGPSKNLDLGSGRIAQRKSVALTRRWSQVRTLLRPLTTWFVFWSGS